MAAAGSGRERLRIDLRGAVQGVGFRPFVYRLATELGLAGWVLNDVRGVAIEVDGPRQRLEELLARLPAEAPPLAVIHSVEARWLAEAGFDGFAIRDSDATEDKSVVVLPDVATCASCLSEILDPADRRHHYPFTNCTDCGPRFSIVERLPYDRPNTSMRNFEMCERCAAEYREPLDRRFHAQPDACPQCGPRIALLDAGGRALAEDEEALEETARALESGRIVALKGLGGFHLMVDAADAGAVTRLRERKARYERPLAVMVADLDRARELCHLDEAAEALLTSPQAPIVLLPRRTGAPIAEEVAPGNPRLGLMLAYTPLHHLLLRACDRPLVATSGNLSDEPICIDNDEARHRLASVADRFLIHNRPIVRHVDDSVLQILAKRPQILRRARGLAPLPVLFDREVPTVLAVGGHLKNSVALAVGDRAFVSQHIGDMESSQARDAFEHVIDDFLLLYDASPRAIAHDLHPDYPSTHWALQAAAGRHGESLAGLELIAVQHHHAHLAACLAEHRIHGPALGITWDGTGYGLDGTVWGGEFLLGDAAAFERVAHLRPFRLPGGERAIREPRRSALALLWEIEGEHALGRTELAPLSDLAAPARRLLTRMLAHGIHSPTTTSAGRLFDAVASLLGLRQRVSYEGQAAIELEFLADPRATGCYPFEILSDASTGRETLIVDWQPLIEAVLADLQTGVGAPQIAGCFHSTLAELIVEVAGRVGQPRVALTGGCFQNRLLTERTRSRLEKEGFEVLLHREVPPNDGGVSLGQLAVAAARLAPDRGGGHLRCV